MSGIYAIVNLANGRCYIGSASKLKNRFAGHRYLLRKKSHHCLPLQNAWNKYGEKAFVFEILELCDLKNLIDNEQLYLDSFKGLYNVAKFAESRLGIKQGAKKRYKSFPALKSPDGRIIGPAENLKALCDQEGLNYKLMNQVVHQEKCSHKGWTLLEAKIPKIPERKVRSIPNLLSPDGNIVSGLSNIKKFCEENGLDRSSFSKVLAGKIEQHKGWKLCV